MLASVQVLAGANAACIVNKLMKFDANDLLDFRHAALAVPYCDVLCCDNPMAQMLRSKPLEFGKTYDTEILGNPDEILLYLNVLAQ